MSEVLVWQITLQLKQELISAGTYKLLAKVICGLAHGCYTNRNIRGKWCKVGSY